MHHRSHDQWGLHPGGRGFCLQGVCIHGGLPPGGDTWDTMGYGQEAGGTHPTGMHSCS